MSCMELLCEEKGKDGIFAYGIKNRYNYLPIDICEENKNRELKEYLEKFSQLTKKSELQRANRKTKIFADLPEEEKVMWTLKGQ